MGNWLVAERIARSVPWYPTQAPRHAGAGKTGLESGTQRFLTSSNQKSHSLDAGVIGSRASNVSQNTENQKHRNLSG